MHDLQLTSTIYRCQARHAGRKAQLTAHLPQAPHAPPQTWQP